jgi:hypothetical protein
MLRCAATQLKYDAKRKSTFNFTQLSEYAKQVEESTKVFKTPGGNQNHKIGLPKNTQWRSSR